MQFAVGDQVKIVSDKHPWAGAIGRIVGEWDHSGGDFIVELESMTPGVQSAVFIEELRSV